MLDDAESGLVLDAQDRRQELPVPQLSMPDSVAATNSHASIVSPATTPSRVVILALWPYAPHHQVHYYISNYLTLYPDARIILVPYQSSNLDADISSLTTIKPTSSSTSPRILLHILGLAAGSRARTLLETYHAQTGTALPATTIIHDAAPPVVLRRPHQPLAEHAALLALLLWTALRSWLLAALAGCGRGEAGLQTLLRHGLHTDARLLPSRARRCYVFADGGRIGFWKASAAGEAKSEGCGWEKFDFEVRRAAVDREGARLGIDGERYWAAIEEAWEQ